MIIESARRRRIAVRIAVAAAAVAAPAALLAAPAFAAPTAPSGQIQLIDHDDFHHCNRWDRDDFCRDRGPGDWHHRRDGGWDNGGGFQPAPQPAPQPGSPFGLPSTGSAGF